MHFYNRLKSRTEKIARGIIALAPYLFIVLLVFSFGEVYLAVLTLLCAVFHELGHIAAMAIIGRSFSLSGVLSGLRLKPKHPLSYGEEIFVASAGPAANAILFLIFIFIGGGYLSAFALVNLFTALSNLLPIRGYDGYGIAYAIISKYGNGNGAYALFSAVSLFTAASLTFLSLYFISRLNSGYWAFFVFILILVREIKRDRRAFYEKKRDFESF